MWPESAEKTTLKTGLTTGTCATACTVSAARVLLEKRTVQHCEVTLPKGKLVSLNIIDCKPLSNNTATAATIKDAGDDPDVTHGATVFAEVTLTQCNDITLTAAEGVGKVTRQGLALAVGEPAINPVPRQMIIAHLEAIKHSTGYTGGFSVAIGIKNGVEIAKKTMNARLGIIGGLSILGTTGIVRPFSCAAYIASIHQGVDVARANNIQYMAACTGNLSEQFATEQFGLTDIALLEMGDFAGAVFKYLKRHPIEKLSIVGGFGKISKLAQGHTDLHSKKSAIDFNFLALCAGELGANQQIQTSIQQANTSIEALALAKPYPLANLICLKAQSVAKNKVGRKTHIEVWCVDRQGNGIGSDRPQQS
ncbi:MAG: cobalt-precorrin-5B (C(1))-methyltransferase [Methylococcales bacterium]|jgi:cobalt-precorrin-5B (C1)-methyltransferase|nr:cobalt-precorrin-5B (C(1))-methyltransferase [Methylococcales bacterium]MBT7442421.1 cobalt-precorrin-5B (C(1))-methyltransferase [Methylococcales bacterium]